MLLSAACLMAMGLWFSASAVVPQLTEQWSLDAAQRSWMTMSVQIGFVAGALFSALLNMADRVPVVRLFAASALGGAIANAAIVWPDPGPGSAIVLRFLTGFFLAGVYPPAMKLVTTWFNADRGAGIGILVGALTLGSAMPHLLNAVPFAGRAGMPPWPWVLLFASSGAALSSIIALGWVRPGPHGSGTAPFNWRFVGRALSDEPTRLANFGYLGHMWELYAMWTWVPLFLLASYEAAGWNIAAARLAGFAAIAAGGAGCVMAGLLADRWGRTAITIASLAISGSCCLLAGPSFSTPAAATAVCLVWGFAVVADSAQFSAAVSELTDPRYVGTALTMQTSLGFLLTLVTIHLVPILVGVFGWDRVFALLAIGPVFGIWSMFRLRRLPESSRMSSGNR